MVLFKCAAYRVGEDGVCGPNAQAALPVGVVQQAAGNVVERVAAKVVRMVPGKAVPQALLVKGVDVAGMAGVSRIPRMTGAALAAVLVGSVAHALPVWASEGGPGEAQSVAVYGQLRGTWVARSPAAGGPLAQAGALEPGIATEPRSEAGVQVEWRASGRLGASGVLARASVTLQAQQPEGGAGHTQGWVNEATLSGGAGAWQWSAGKQVVSWDVGYAFRPNDLVQQEVRRGLAPVTLQGRPLLMAEHFTADTAWSVLLVNPAHARSSTGAGEPAWAARVYQRAGEVDWHGFARWGFRTAGSAGVAASWVASEALELHASLRHMAHFDTLAYGGAGSGGASAAAIGLPATPLLAANPWQSALGGRASQMLVGGTWTNDQQLSLLAEAWYDGTALSSGQWRQWAARNQGLLGWPALGVPAGAVAGNLAWQASAFSASGTSGNLHRQNVFARLSWAHGAWQPALDVLYHPADGGRLLTASLVWQGDRMKVEGGVRLTGGPATAVVRQLPVQRQGFVAGTWAF